MRRPALMGLLAAAFVVLQPAWVPPGQGGGAYPPGSTNAVLSFIDDSHVEVVRHWPQRSQDVVLTPFTPYLWDFCLPGMGAIIVLLTAPVDLPPIWAMANPEYYDPDAHIRKVLPALLGQVQGVVGRIEDGQVRDVLQRSLVPGNPLYEQLKAAIGAEVRSLRTYQKYGYATFLFIKGGWFWFWPICTTAIESVSEGYGIPYVR